MSQSIDANLQVEQRRPSEDFITRYSRRAEKDFAAGQNVFNKLESIEDGGHAIPLGSLRQRCRRGCPSRPLAGTYGPSWYVWNASCLASRNLVNLLKSSVEAGWTWIKYPRPAPSVDPAEVMEMPSCCCSLFIAT